MTITDITISSLLPAPLQRRDTSASEVWGRDVTFRRGEFCAVEAASGGGKSSLCGILYGLRRDYSGTVAFSLSDDRDAAGPDTPPGARETAGRHAADLTDARSLSPSQWCALRREALAFLPQDLRLFPELTALDNVLIKNRLTGALSEEEILEMFVALGIDGLVSAPCGTLSWGEQQRVAIIRALCQPFAFLLLDEPVSHLDPANNRAASALILARARSLGAGIISTSVGNPLLIPFDTTLRL